MTSSALRQRPPRPGWHLARAPTPAAVETAVRAAWSRDTCDESDAPVWSPANPARGQCGPTALTVQDLLGGELLLAEVWGADGSWLGYHWWNRLPGGPELDLTRDQFGPGEVVQLPRAVERPPGRPRRCAAQYDRLRARVLAALGADGAGPGHIDSSRSNSSR